MRYISDFNDLYRNISVRLDSDLKDEYAVFWLPIQEVDSSFPVRTNGNGACFFNAASRLLYGDERLAGEIRIRVLHEAIQNQERYINHNYLATGFPTWLPTAEFDNLPDVYASMCPSFSQASKRFQTPEYVYRKDIIRLAAPFAEATAWQPHQLAEVIQRPVVMFYPDMPNITGTFAHLRDALSRVCQPEDEDMAKRTPITIAWSRTVPHEFDCNPNHFVAIVK